MKFTKLLNDGPFLLWTVLLLAAGCFFPLVTVGQRALLVERRGWTQVDATVLSVKVSGTDLDAVEYESWQAVFVPDNLLEPKGTGAP